MQKARIIFATICLLAVIGCFFAFRAKDLNKFVYVPSTAASTICSIKLLGYTTVPNGQTPVILRASTVSGGACMLITIYPTD